MKYWMIETWMQNHLVNDSNRKFVDLQYPQKLQGMTINVKFTFSVDDNRCAVKGLRSVLRKTNRIGDTKYTILV